MNHFGRLGPKAPIPFQLEFLWSKSNHRVESWGFLKHIHHTLIYADCIPSVLYNIYSQNSPFSSYIFVVVYGPRSSEHHHIQFSVIFSVLSSIIMKRFCLSSSIENLNTSCIHMQLNRIYVWCADIISFTKWFGWFLMQHPFDTSIKSNHVS